MAPVNTADDPEANHTPGGGYAYRNAGPSRDTTRRATVEMPTPF
jgi:hypothetical protein